MSFCRGTMLVVLAYTYVFLVEPLVQAQRSIDVALPANLPLTEASVAFSNGTTYAFAGNGQVHVLGGLPLAPTSLTLTPPGPLGMVTDWQKLSESTAIYRAVGEDLTPKSADDPLVLITGLPSNPLPVSTSIYGVDPGFTPVNDTTAARVNPASNQFEILRFGPAGATVLIVPAPTPLVRSESYESGVISEATYAAYGAGPDQIAGTADDQIVVLGGLDGASFPVATFPVGASSIEGLIVSRTGVCVIWTAPVTNALVVRLIQNTETSPAMISVTIPFPQGVFPGYALPHGVTQGPGDSVIAWFDDDTGPGRYSCFIRNVSGTPSVSPLWHDNYEFQIWNTVIAENEIVTDYLYDPTGPMLYTSFAGPAPVTESLPQSSAHPFAYFRTSRLGLVRISQHPLGDTTATIYTGLPGATAATSFAATGLHTIRADRVAEGLVAWFVGSSPASTPTLLRLVTVPTFERVGNGTTLGPSPMTLSITPAAPMASGVLQMSAYLPPQISGGAAVASNLVFASGITSPTQLPGTSFQTHLDLLLLSPDLVPLSQSGPFGTLSADVSNLVPYVGIAVYVQALGLFPNAGGLAVVLGDTYRIILG